MSDISYATSALHVVLLLGGVVGCSRATPLGPQPSVPDPEPTAPGPSTVAPAAAAPTAAEPAPVANEQVTARFAAKSGSDLTGNVSLRATDAGVEVVIAVQNVSPGKHGAHFHEVGDCTAADATSAGGHLNPDRVAHGLPPALRHLGDLGNIAVGDERSGRLEIMVPDANLVAGDERSLRGRAIIIHAREDDGGQPTGNAGARIGCAVVPAS